MESKNHAEVSFLVRDDWQEKGIGTYLLNILTEIAKKRGIKGFDAVMLTDNQRMLAVFHNSGYAITTKKEDNTYEISFDFQ
ncbi:MAG: GNAT family N-acetyltransferase [candidate division WOR-3 bacterium]